MITSAPRLRYTRRASEGCYDVWHGRACVGIVCRVPDHTPAGQPLRWCWISLSILHEEIDTTSRHKTRRAAALTLLPGR
jgi:hypothetical protein